MWVIEMIKRVWAFLLALALALGLSACGGPAAQPPLSAPSAPAVQEPSGAPETSPAETQQPADPAPEASEEASSAPSQEPPEESAPTVAEDGWYSSKEEVALYIHLYGHLPDNYLTKKEAQDLGWTGGSVERYAGEGTAIGGSRFGNYEGLLPEAKGRVYTECDIDTVGASSRGAKRVVFSNDGLVYYTGDHYESFELLYGEP
ncbi:MAG: ribonuclease [Oscillospiraceae bacterium]|nr:ribonuclease [Oscillospiraceae bacterium]